MADEMTVELHGNTKLAKYLNKLGKDGHQTIIDEIKSTTLKIENTYKNNLKQVINRENSTGDTINNIDHKIEDKGFTGIVLNDKDTATWLEFGTKPHKIRIKNKKVLSDKVDFFGTEVNHPGTRATLALTMAFLKFVGVDGKKLIRRIGKRYDKIK